MSDGISLEQIHEKHPKANYAPDPDCAKCGGDGEWYYKESERMHPCICIFVQHDFAPDAARILGELARDELRKMDDA